MKNKIKLMLVVLLSISLLACTNNGNKDDEAEKVLNKMIDVMHEKQSFSMEVMMLSKLPNQEQKRYASNQQFNNYFSDNKEYKIALKIAEDRNSDKELYSKNGEYVIVYGSQNDVFPPLVGNILYYEGIEFLNVKNKYVKSLKYIENDKEKELILNVEFEDEENQRSYFGEGSLGHKSDKIEGIVKIRLNDDYTMKFCESSYAFMTEVGGATQSSEIEFLNYGPQDIQFPEGM